MLKAVITAWVFAQTVAVPTALPHFEDYPATRHYSGTPTRPQLASARYGRKFRTVLRDGARKGPNFAGAYTVVMWGCGSGCQFLAVIDAATGRLSRQTLHSSNGVEYRVDSRLLIADPVRSDDPPRGECASCGVEAAYVWTGRAFRPIGTGPHPHLTDFQP